MTKIKEASANLVWIGLTDEAENGVWKTLDNQPVTWFQWSPAHSPGHVTKNHIDFSKAGWKNIEKTIKRRVACAIPVLKNGKLNVLL